MLKLRRLELSGFKSFVDPVSLDVHGGMTAIVGPNGCGKSNLADAVVWALGERSAKSLRGERMEDVIFAGAKGRRPLGMAEVTLELATDNGFPAAEDGRVTIGRRVYRNGESQYLLNGKSVRLKDIKELLMDTGLGIRAYSVIEQGKIGMILSGKPQERRKLLEEAAGITRYRERRRVAEIKLEEARANLERLDDVLTEVAREVRSLKRQSNAARRYKARQEQYHALLRRVLEGRWSLLQGRLRALKTQLDELVARETAATAELHRHEAGRAEAREELERIAQELAARHSRVAELAAAIEGKQEFLKGSRERRQEIAERLEAGRVSAVHSRQRLTELEQSLEQLAARRTDLQAERDRAASELTEHASRVSEVEALVSQVQDRLESLRSRLLTSINHLTSQRNRLHLEQVEREKGELRRRHLEIDLKRKGVELGEATELKEQTSSRVAELRSSVDDLEQQLQQHRETLEEAHRRRHSEADRAEEMAERIDFLQRRQLVLRELEEKQEERRAEIRAALEEAGLGRRSFLSERLQVPEGWAASLDLFLGALEDAVLLEPGDDALGLARSLSRGRATGRLLLPHGTSHHVHLRIDDPAVQASLGEALALPAETAAVLPPAYLVDSPADAQRLARSNPGVAFISRDRLWAQAGAIHFHGEQAKPGLLERATELAELHETLPPLESELVSVKQELERQAAEIRLQEDRIRQQEQRLAEQQAQLTVAQVRYDEARTRHHRLAAEHQTLAEELTASDSEIQRLVEQVERLGTGVQASESSHRQMELAFDAAQQEVERARENREASRTSEASRRGRLEVLAARLDAHDLEMSRVRREIEEHHHHLELWQAEADRLDERQQAITASMHDAERELQAALEQRTSSEHDVLSQQQHLDEHRTHSRQLEDTIEELRRRRDELRSEISEARVIDAGVRQEAEHLAAEFRQHFAEEPPEEVSEPSEPLDEIEVDLARKKERLERMGPVNLLAAGEYEERAQRLEFLTSQRADVETSVNRLKQTIREINRTSSRRFRETFDEVNRHFRQTYAELFRGGEAEMRLLDEDDLLETVIEIVARPPGKRLQNILLLSGGEKALTAIALLFALFRTKPSPFCILDEVDAPLDDLNTLRFLEMLRNMAEGTQFVIITHNKLTMEAANLLYGVTMQERGVSNLVSVELDELQPAEAPAAAAAAG